MAYCTCLAYLSAPWQDRWGMTGLRNRGTPGVAASKLRLPSACERRAPHQRRAVRCGAGNLRTYAKPSFGVSDDGLLGAGADLRRALHPADDGPELRS